MDLSNSRSRRTVLPLTAIIAFILLIFWTLPSGKAPADLSSVRNSDPDVTSWCPLPAKPGNVKDGLKPSFLFVDIKSVEKQVERLSRAVNVPTISYGDNGDVETDPRYDTFHKFHDVLEDLFPLVHEELELSSINHIGLLYTFKGSDEELRPILFAAHQDVVPATSLEKWTHPPFEAFYDGKFVWGRGASDCKNNLIGILSVVEHLLEQEWKPKRTILLAFGFDEEVGGERGAKHIAAELEKRYGRHGVAMIMDEGGMGVEISGKYAYALPAVAEKGFVDIHLTLEVNGGHSSRPPQHSGIGIMAEMIVALERKPFRPRLTKENPFRGYLECQVRYSPHDVESWLRDALLTGKDEVLIGDKLAYARGEEVRFSMQTSQAVDVINAGEATNQLPETVKTIVNYRIAQHDSLTSVKAQVAEVVSPIAKRYDVAVKGFGTDGTVEQGKQLLILTSTDDLSPSPTTSTGSDSKVWSLFGGTLRNVFEDVPTLKGKTVIPVGDIMTGNTDTIHYWNVSENIFRFSPARAGTRMGIHTVDERVDISAHIEGMRVYYDLMRNFDVAKI